MIRIISSISMLVMCFCTNAQVDWRGIVYDEDGQALPGIHVQVGQSISVTDKDGQFEVTIPSAGSYEVTIHGVGYELLTQEVLLPVDEVSEFTLRSRIYLMEPIELTGSWVKEDQPFTYSEVSEEVLAQDNVGQDVPYLLRWTPSTVVTSDAGTGIGYTGIRIRGSDPSRINVTIDGVPLNDAESQFVFWVDLPDLASSANEIQIQRGAGTSTNGAGAFGGTINVKTEKVQTEPHASIDLSGGSFNTRRATLQFGSGLLADKFTFEGRLSSIHSDGYIDRGSADLRSYYLSGTYIDNKQSLKLKLFSGHEVTYQAWNGVPAQYLDDPATRTFNTAGMRADGSFHPDEVDDYTQTHFHAIYNRSLGSTVAQIGLHYTKGMGFFEQYRVNDALADYRLSPVEIGELAISSSDLIRRRWLDNDFYGTIFSISREEVRNSYDWTIGGGYNIYLGDHFGEVIWARFMSDAESGHEYYRNDARKTDFNIYAQWEQPLSSRWQVFGDLQWRRVDYSFFGFDQNLQQTDQRVTLDFINPKAGLVFQDGPLKGYYSFAVAQREPNRDDFVESSPNSRPRSEALFDHELGLEWRNEQLALAGNLYFMKYRDQLILTGAINDVGAYVRTNVPSSYRAGLELQAAWTPTSRWRLEGNATLSRNRLKRFEEAIDNWDTGGQDLVVHENTPIAFSPEQIVQGSLQYQWLARKLHRIETEWIHKYVGQQYLDNTGSEASRLDAYYFSDFHIRWEMDPNWCETISFKILIQNLFDLDIVTNGWIYRYRSPSYDGRPDDPHTRLEEGNTYNLSGFYPQAGRNVMAGVTLSF